MLRPLSMKATGSISDHRFHQTTRQ